MFDSDYLDTVFQNLADRGFSIETGLTDTEICRAENLWGFQFPPDLRSFLQHGQPFGEIFPNWRIPDSESLRSQIHWPCEGICFDIKHNEFWLEAWGERPRDVQVAQEVARNELKAAPFLIPVFGHRYMAASPCAAGNPVLSVYQTDIICYGVDLCDYLHHEFGIANPNPRPDRVRTIQFWSDLI